MKNYKAKTLLVNQSSEKEIRKTMIKDLERKATG